MKRSLAFWGVSIVVLAAVPFWTPLPRHHEAVRENLASASERRAEPALSAVVRTKGGAAGPEEQNSEPWDALRAEVEDLREQLRQTHEELALLRDRASRAEIEELQRELTASLEEARSAVTAHLSRLDGSLNAERKRAEEASAKFAKFETLLGRDRDEMDRTMMRPIVRLSGANTVGSGIVIATREGVEQGRWNNFVVTSYHVVRDILLDARGDRSAEIKVAFYNSNRHDDALGTLLAYDEHLDLALLVIVRDEAWGHVATLATAEEEREAERFAGVYAVGCPLGNDPIPTRGEILSLDHRLEDQSFWMISAPSYFGNSGGGVFSADSHHLLGIFSKIYTHGRSFPTVIPHMGLLMPTSVVREWIVRAGHGELVTS